MVIVRMLEGGALVGPMDFFCAVEGEGRARVLPRKDFVSSVVEVVEAASSYQVLDLVASLTDSICVVRDEACVVGARVEAAMEGPRVLVEGLEEEAVMVEALGRRRLMLRCSSLSFSLEEEEFPESSDDCAGGGVAGRLRRLETLLALIVRFLKIATGGEGASTGKDVSIVEEEWGRRTTQGTVSSCCVSGDGGEDRS